ncbi:MAG TPA: hypothetical protein VFI31_16290 [Pirellulales bacterium]|nr:hypothetical protein [Pirellulales bacterium]
MKRTREVQYLASGFVAELAAETGAFALATVSFNARFPPRRREPWDIVCRWQITGRKEPVTVVIVCREQLSPKTALALVESRPAPSGATLVLFCPAISPRVAQICRERHVGYLDEAGNCLLRVGSLYIERAGRGNVRPDTRPIRRLFSPKAGRVTRAMLTEPSKAWQVQELAAAAQVSLGLASKVKQTLLAEGYAGERDRLLYLRDPRALLDAWSRAYAPRVEPIRLLVTCTAAGAVIARWLASHGVTFALTEQAGACRAAATTEITRIAFWVDSLPPAAWADFAAATGGERVVSGENVVLYPTDDTSVFVGVRLLGDPPLPTVSPLQLYLDLRRLGDAETAADLYEHELAGQFATAPCRSGFPA